MGEQGDGNAAVTRALTKPFPKEAIKTRSGGGGSVLSYVEGESVIRRLIAATDNTFDVRVLHFESKPAGQTRGGAPQTLLVATVELCVPGLGCRQHIGVQMTSEGGGEDLAKGAVTDAIKKAATLFGVGLELYGPDYEAAAGEPAISDTTNKRLHAAAGDKGIEHDGIRFCGWAMYGAESTKHLTEAEATELCRWFERLAPVEAEYLGRLISAKDGQALAAVAASMKQAGVGNDLLRAVYKRKERAFAAAS